MSARNIIRYTIGLPILLAVSAVLLILTAIFYVMGESSLEKEFISNLVIVWVPK